MVVVGVLAAGAALLCAVSTVDAGQRLTYLELVKRLTDLEQLAALPAAGETCQQWSSYDRRSR